MQITGRLDTGRQVAVLAGENMSQLARVHIVMGENNQVVVEEIGRQCQVTYWNRSLEEAVTWASSGGGEDPDIILINCGDYAESSDNRSLHGLINCLRIIKQKRSQSRIVALIPLESFGELELIAGLVKLGIYDLWFLDAFDEGDIFEFLTSVRSREGLEAYIRELEQGLFGREKDRFARTGPLSEKLFSPYLIKSNVLAFYSAEDTQTNTGLAILTALSLAELGFKVALAESVAGVPHLAAAMSVRHPYFNTSHAFSMYSLGNTNFLRNCLFNRRKYLADSYSLDKSEHSCPYPENLYFLPDGQKEYTEPLAELQTKWRGFATELTKIAMFEQDFHFLIYLCNGRSLFNEVVIKELAYHRFIIVNLLPGSIIYGLNEITDRQDNIHLIVSTSAPYITEGIKDLSDKAVMFCPAELQTDILHCLYFRKYGETGIKTQEFVNALTGMLGVRLQKSQKRHGIKARILSWKVRIWGSV